MDKNEIKKALYKEKPTARLLHRIDDKACYKAYLKNGYSIAFEVPQKEMGETIFEPEMEAQLLIRWLL